MSQTLTAPVTATPLGPWLTTGGCGHGSVGTALAPDLLAWVPLAWALPRGCPLGPPLQPWHPAVTQCPAPVPPGATARVPAKRAEVIFK